jgi:hypothetical protein
MGAERFDVVDGIEVSCDERRISGEGSGSRGYAASPDTMKV